MLRYSGLLLVMVLGFSTSVASSATPYDHQAYLPLVMRPAGCPPVRVFDYDGNEQDWAWLVQTFGAVVILSGTGSACAVELRAKKDDSTLLVTVLDSGGQPLGGITVVFHWPGAPSLPPDLVGCYDEGVYGVTKQAPDPAAGTVGFGMGQGAYYDPPAGGPHTVWVGVAGSDCISGLGMLANTNHYHLDPTFALP
jgi:hypothetical protein